MYYLRTTAYYVLVGFAVGTVPPDGLVLSDPASSCLGYGAVALWSTPCDRCRAFNYYWEIDKIGYTRVVSEQNRVPFFRDGARLRNLPVVCGIFRVGLRCCLLYTSPSPRD